MAGGNPVAPTSEYIFIDESGDLGQKGSKYLILAALMVNELKGLDRIVKKARFRYKKELAKAGELKANKSSDAVRACVLEKTNGLKDARIFFIVLEKEKIVSEYLKSNKHKLYNYVAGKLAGYLPLASLNTSIRIDRSKGRQLLENDFNAYFLSKLGKNASKITIQHSDSQNWAGLQVADFLAWACFQKFERGNSFFIELIKIQNEVYYVW